jgi:hypothetical protein
MHDRERRRAASRSAQRLLIATAACAASLVACKGKAPRSLERSPPARSAAVSSSGADAAATITLPPASATRIQGAAFLPDGTAVIARLDQLEFVGVDGAVRARIAYRGTQWAVSRTASKSELAVLQSAAGKNTITFFTSSGRESGVIDAGPGKAPYVRLVQFSSRRVLFTDGLHIRAIERPSGRVVATLLHFPGLVDEDATRSVLDQGSGELAVTELDGSGTKRVHRYRHTEIDSDGLQTADGLTLAPDGRTLAIQEPSGIVVVELPSGARTFLEGPRLLHGSARIDAGTHAHDPLSWRKPGKLALAEKDATLVLVDRADPTKVERMAPKAWCEEKNGCRSKYGIPQLIDVQWTSAGTVVLAGEWPTLLWWTPGASPRPFHPGERDDASQALSADGRYVLDSGRSVRVFAPPSNPKAAWKLVAEDARGTGIFSPDGLRALLWHADGFRLIELESGRALASRDASPGD